MEDGLISEILVDTKNSAWKISLIINDKLDAGQIGELENALVSLVLGLSKVQLHVIYKDQMPSLEDRINQNWEKLVNGASDKYPGINGWLAEARYKMIEDRLLEIQVRNQIGVDYLKCRVEEIKELLQDLVFEDIQCSFVVGEFEEYIPEEPDLESLYKATVDKKQTEKAKTKPENSNLIYGKTFGGESTPIKKLLEEEEQVIVYGEIIRIESRISKTNRKFFLGDITDHSDSIGFKIFPRNENHQIEEDCWMEVGLS